MSFDRLSHPSAGPAFVGPCSMKGALWRRATIGVVKECSSIVSKHSTLMECDGIEGKDRIAREERNGEREARVSVPY